MHPRLRRRRAVRNAYPHIGRDFNMEDVANGGVPRLGAAVTPGTKIEYEMPDMYGRPWAAGRAA
jgi:hypothetical protein